MVQNDQTDNINLSLNSQPHYMKSRLSICILATLNVCSAAESLPLMPTFEPQVDGYAIGFSSVLSRLSTSSTVNGSGISTSPLNNAVMNNGIGSYINYRSSESLTIGVSGGITTKNEEETKTPANLQTGLNNPTFSVGYKPIRESDQIGSISLAVTPKTSSNGLRSFPTTYAITGNSAWLIKPDTWIQANATYRIFGSNYPDSVNLTSSIIHRFDNVAISASAGATKVESSHRNPASSSLRQWDPTYSLALSGELSKDLFWIATLSRTTSKTSEVLDSGTGSINSTMKSKSLSLGLTSLFN